MFFADLLNLLKTFTVKRLWNSLKIVLSYLFSLLIRKSIHRGLPLSLSIESSAVCHLKCPQCPVGQKKLKRPQGLLTFKNYKKIIDDNAAHLFYLLLYFQGEPFLNKHLIEMIRYAKKFRIYTFISTNAQHIDEEMAKAIVKSGLDKIVISLDGITNKTYTTYRKNGQFSLVINSIKHIAHYKALLNTSSPLIELQFLALKSNEKDMEQLKDFSKKLNMDKLTIKTAQIYNYEKDAERYMPNNSKYSRYIKKKGKYVLKRKIRNRCFRMWHSAVVTWDGRLAPCCYDKDAAHSFGNVFQTPLKVLWKSEAYDTFRNQIINNRKQISLCCNCNN